MHKKCTFKSSGTRPATSAAQTQMPLLLLVTSLHASKQHTPTAVACSWAGSASWPALLSGGFTLSSLAPALPPTLPITLKFVS